MSSGVRRCIEEALGVTVTNTTPLSGGCIGEVYRADLSDGERVVAKVDGSADPKLDIEGFMLTFLAEHSALPVPTVLHSTPGLLIMEFMPGDSHFGAHAQQHAAELLSELHAIRADRFGLERDTLIGPLHQANPHTDSWIDFFRDQRILPMARAAHDESQFGKATLKRIESFADHLEEWLLEPEHPGLIHGDLWTTNILARGDRITGFIDPAVYYGHPEIELAYSTLFGTFTDPFFRRYHEIRPIPDGFFEVRRDIYTMYPLLVHVRLFGATYLSGIENVLDRHGY
jgi:fructosamine-3-kinase